uniref:Uncharacterized protein n=1 Tax=Arundo donax TaxID=35708 RepID=A0A0A9EG84_ARUDO
MLWQFKIHLNVYNSMMYNDFLKIPASPTQGCLYTVDVLFIELLVLSPQEMKREEEKPLEKKNELEREAAGEVTPNKPLNKFNGIYRLRCCLYGSSYSVRVP